MALLGGLIVAGRWFVTADPKTLAKALKWVAGALILAIIVSLAVTGRLGWAIMALPALLPWVARARAVHRAAKNFSRMSAGVMGGGSGRTSEVRTRFLKMVLDHDSGTMNGEVIDGTHAGHRLDDLSLAELLDLLNTCHLQEAQSAQLLETYLDRVHPDWRERLQKAGAGTGTGGGGTGGPVPGGMSREEAYQILGLEPGAGDDDIKAAHHRLIANLHPDRGGSTYLAAKINQAKDVLLGT